MCSDSEVHCISSSRRHLGLDSCLSSSLRLAGPLCVAVYLCLVPCCPMVLLFLGHHCFPDLCIFNFTGFFFLVMLALQDTVHFSQTLRARCGTQASGHFHDCDGDPSHANLSILPCISLALSRIVSIRISCGQFSVLPMKELLSEFWGTHVDTMNSIALVRNISLTHSGVSEECSFSRELFGVGIEVSQWLRCWYRISVVGVTT